MVLKDSQEFFLLIMLYINTWILKYIKYEYTVKIFSFYIIPVIQLINPFKPASYFKNCRTKANSADPDQTPHNVVSDQGLHCLLTECSIKI